jgi:hypothetical protein
MEGGREDFSAPRHRIAFARRAMVSEGMDDI